MVETSKDIKKTVTFGLPDSINFSAISNGLAEATQSMTCKEQRTSDVPPTNTDSSKIPLQCSKVYAVAKPDTLDFASAKVIELSKRLRELMACLLTERTKNRHLEGRIKILDAMVRESRMEANRELSQPLRLSTNRAVDTARQIEQNTSTKGTLAKLAKSEEIIKILRNENHTLKHDLREAKRVLELETGEKIENINLWLKTLILERGSGSERRGRSMGGWRGRQQQISLLRSKVKSLESRLNSMSPLRLHVSAERIDDLDTVDTDQKSGATTLGIESIFGESNLELPLTQRQSVTDKNKITLLEQEITKLNSDLQSYKNKFAKAKARENSLSVETQEMKKKMIKLFEKGKHDDELVSAMMETNQKLQDNLRQQQEEAIKSEQHLRNETEKLMSTLAQKKNELEKLEKILFQKDDEIRDLENAVRNLPNASNCAQVSNSQSEIMNGGLGANTEKTLIVEERDKLEKQITLLEIERDGLRKLVETVNGRVDSLVQENADLKYELSLRNSEKSSSKISNARSFNHDESKRTKATESELEEKCDRVSKKPNKIEIERLLSRQFLIDTLSKCALSAASANTVSKQIGILQSALTDSYGEIERLRELGEKLRSIRREDFNLLSEIVQQLRVASENDKV
ncbi:hypothetical protein D915_007432 [Fasciola hepatica]|uniref:Coiled-coil domain-containing protein n=1 Tax=Fasciola hepatica TaxID=6192 RepID=A0A4E0R2Z5_FASHE|nr:hypothetical protein D915_007432 [Fasciola hepatica]